MLKIKRSDLHKVWNTLYKLKDLGDKSLTFYIQRNLASFEDEVKFTIVLQDSAEPSEEFLVYDRERIELGKSLADLDEKGEPIIENMKFVFSSKAQAKWEKEFAKFTTKYKDVIIEHDKTINELQQLMGEEIELDFKKIPFSLLPESVNYFEIKDLIKETEEEVEQIILGTVETVSIDSADVKNTNAIPFYLKPPFTN